MVNNQSELNQELDTQWVEYCYLGSNLVNVDFSNYE